MLKSGAMDYTNNMKRCHDYVEALEQEQKKIQVFQRELPLCLELVTQAIESCRKELSESSSMSEHARSQSECSERTTSECGDAAPVFEEFIPIKWTSSSSDANDKDHVADRDESIKTNSDNNAGGDKKKSDWLRSVQLWNQSSPDPQPKDDQVIINKKAAVIEVKRNNAGAFQPFQKDKPNKKANYNNDDSPQPLIKAITPTPTTTSSSTAETTVGGKNEFEQLKQSPSNRKQRRCWSPELHRRFLHALQQLGGSHVATPKQIRDLMKVDGLTNDEVKSHLQKYRLHTRRPATPVSTNVGENTQQQQQQRQFMVVEGIWVPSSHDATNGRVYAPVATQPQQPSPSGERSSTRCKSPATSSSTHTPHLLPLS
ncbi:hypothetical protein CARUB_v10009492mg [Capsella rubella]|uniref:HTH myb-type domain-containing protein n=1 Tax=Capsella rubella TaxID=81985 RepID=R0GQJ3_9BRAS|nr:transcription factor HHO3 [Capsella rubella]EOA38021.1 hypothetical protein CARUB_v10009492mg [Capsella rubella]